MPTDAAAAKEERVFYCRNKIHEKWVWLSSEYLADEDGINHANCPICDKPTPEVSRRYLSLKAMWDNQTGEQTEKGKRRVRLNAYKHGMRSQIFHMMAPAKPGTYLECNTCEYFEPCKNEKWRWCPVQVEPLMRFQDAYEDGKITDLRDLAAMSQGHIFQSLRMAFQQIYKHGVLIEKVVKIEEIEHDDGSVEKVKVTEWQPNPVLRRIPELMNTLGFTAEQQMMTPKTETDDANVKGYLDSEKEKKVDLKSHLIKIENSMNDLKLQTKRAMVQRAQDEALQRHDRQVELEREESDAGQE